MRPPAGCGAAPGRGHVTRVTQDTCHVTAGTLGNVVLSAALPFPAQILFYSIIQIIQQSI